MKPKSPEAVVDSATARQKGRQIANREPISLDLKGAVASVIVQLVAQATAQAIQSDGARIAVSSFLEGKDRKANEGWKVHVESMEFIEPEQSLRITGLKLVPV